MPSYPVKSPKKLIEVALPLDSINLAAAREKSIRHGHPSTLHLWWARRPLAAARAVLFGQLVNDPGFERSLNRGLPKKEAARERKRLFKIIEKLVLWENTTNESVLNEAREEIRKSWLETCELNKDHPQAKELFNPDKLPAFHDPFAGGGAIPLEAQRLGLESYASDLNPVAVLINKAMIEIPPKFADRPPVNPDVRKDKHLFEREWHGAQGLAEDVRYYGKWIRDEAEKRIGHLYPKIEITTEMANERPDLKPLVGSNLTMIASIWARTVKSPNPAFANVDVPLASTFMLSSKVGREAYIEPVIQGNNYYFSVKMGKPYDVEGAQNGTKLARGANFKCLMSNAPMDNSYVRAEFQGHRSGKRMMAIVADSDHGRVYISPTAEMEAVALKSHSNWRPEQQMNQESSNLVSGRGYGIHYWYELFTERQLLALTTFADLVQDAREHASRDAIIASFPDDGIALENNGSGAAAYADAVATYLGLAVSRTTNTINSFSVWSQSREQSVNLFSRQAIPMAWDFPEVNPFAGAAGDFGATTASMSKTIIIESGPLAHVLQSDAQTQELSQSKVISTDPPYYDNIAYADLSDFFYVWLRRSLKLIFPNLFATLAVPKTEELVATPYRHGGKEEAENFFMDGMTQAMHRLAIQAHPAFPVTIYYAFKQSDTTKLGTSNTGWETFLDAVIRAGFGITGTWPLRTERPTGVKTGTNALASSIILVCRKRSLNASTITRREFLRELKEELDSALDVMIVGSNNVSPVAPVDLAQAIIGPGMAIYSKYSSVLEADGSTMSVHTALILINRVLTEGKDEFDANTLFSLSWFDQCGWNAGDFGSADVLARAKGTSVDIARNSGVIESHGGKVRLLKPAEYSDTWDPQRDAIIPSWELLHRLSSRFEHGGTEEAAKLLARVESTKVTPASVRKLAYQLYTLCERTGKAEDARRYNNLILAWDTISQLAESLGRAGTQVNLFQGV